MRAIRACLIAAMTLIPAVVAAVDLPPGPHTDRYTGVGIIGLTVTNLGYVGTYFEPNGLPSCEYPLNSNVEHLFSGGLWVGAITADGSIHVTTGSQDASGLSEGDEIREFDYYINTNDPNDPENSMYIWSNSQNSEHYNEQAVATQHIQSVFHDYTADGTGSHVPLGLKVTLRALAWSSSYADDFVILDYIIVNNSSGVLRDVYVGFYNDCTVGNTEHTNPYDPNAPVGWNFYNGVNGAWGPEEWVPGENTVDDDPDIWMMYEHDDDGDEGLATSWIGTRLLGVVPLVENEPDQQPVSYNAWSFRGVPSEDDEYEDDEGPQDGKYQIMSNEAFTVGETQERDYSIPANWVALMSTGPWSSMAPGDTIHATFAIICGPDSLGLLGNSVVAQNAYNQGFNIASGPPSPQIEVSSDWNTVKLQWAPGDSLDADGYTLPIDDPRRSSEFHISSQTRKYDFQGYRIYRFQGEIIDRDPYSISNLVAQYDVIDDVGFNTGLPPLNDDGLREFTDANLLDVYPYWYSVTAYSAPDLDEGLPEFQSGFNENAVLVYPGPAPSPSAADGGVTVVPNPYRTESAFDRGGGSETGRRIWFLGLPEQCTIKVFTVAGDLVTTLRHSSSTEGKESWNLLSDHGRTVASGLYVYVVENRLTGEIQRGKLVIIK